MIAHDAKLRANKRHAQVRRADSETLRRWLLNNEALIDQYDSTTEAADIQLCKTLIRDINAELCIRAE